MFNNDAKRASESDQFFGTECVLSRYIPGGSLSVNFLPCMLKNHLWPLAKRQWTPHFCKVLLFSFIFPENTLYALVSFVNVVSKPNVNLLLWWNYRQQYTLLIKCRDVILVVSGISSLGIRCRSLFHVRHLAQVWNVSKVWDGLGGRFVRTGVFPRRWILTTLVIPFSLQHTCACSRVDLWRRLPWFASPVPVGLKASPGGVGGLLLLYRILKITGTLIFN